MKPFSAWMLVVCLTLQPGLAGSARAGDTAAKIPVKNVSLQKDGSFRGLLIAPDKTPFINADVVVETKAGKHAVKTDARGLFTTKNVSNGPCKIVVDDRTYVCRLWKAGMAPPKALTLAGIVHGPDHLIRGQSYDDCGDACGEPAGGFGKLGGVSGGQWLGLALIGGTVAAIAIAASNDDDDAS